MMDLLCEQPPCRNYFDRYPELRAPLVAGEFWPDLPWPCSSWSFGHPVEIACYRMPRSRSTLRFHVRSCDTGDGVRWHAWGDWCEYGRTAHDACYDFLDGGGSFVTRATAEWAIHLYVARLLADEASSAA